MAKNPPLPTSREREVFLRALEVSDPGKRQTFVERACGADHGLRATVETLLAYHHEDEFLETPADGLPLESKPIRLFGEENCQQADALIGPYKLLEQIGEGGFGVVFLAEQTEPIRRRVALKIIKAGMDTKQVIARFEAERQALALMDHPNIAKVLDGGVTGQRSETRGQRSEIRSQRGTRRQV